MTGRRDDTESSEPGPSDRTASDLAREILPSSGTMIGICATFVGLAKILDAGTRPTHADELAAVLAVVFLASTLLSYIAIRIARTRAAFARRCERGADALFLIGLVSLVGLALLFAFDNV